MRESSSIYLGYRDGHYAKSLAFYGKPLYLENSNGWCLERLASPSNSLLKDIMGVYPYFSCSDWYALPRDVEWLKNEGYVSLVMVTDPMQSVKAQTQQDLFELSRLFKMNFVMELITPFEKNISRHHRYYARKAAKKLNVKVLTTPLDGLEEWYSLYLNLIHRHSITGVRKFSKDSFALLFQTPGVSLFKAYLSDTLVGAQIMILQDDVAHAHLSAFTAEGYIEGASYLLDWSALEFMQGKVGAINWGSGLEGHDGTSGGLAEYKRGWSSTLKPSYLYGSILNPDLYTKLMNKSNTVDSAYFPSYRQNESF